MRMRMRKRMRMRMWMWMVTGTRMGASCTLSRGAGGGGWARPRLPRLMSEVVMMVTARVVWVYLRVTLGVQSSPVQSSPVQSSPVQPGVSTRTQPPLFHLCPVPRAPSVPIGDRQKGMRIGPDRARIPRSVIRSPRVGCPKNSQKKSNPTQCNARLSTHTHTHTVTDTQSQAKPSSGKLKEGGILFVFILDTVTTHHTSGTMDPTNLFDTQFVIDEIDPDGKKFDRGTLPHLTSYPNPWG